MNTTMDLLTEALAMQRQSKWAQEMAVSDSTLTQAKKRKSVSPAMAGHMAKRLGKDPIYWTALAAIETEPDSIAKREVLGLLAQLSAS